MISRKYKCTECGKEFSRIEYLIRHYETFENPLWVASRSFEKLKLILLRDISGMFNRFKYWYRLQLYLVRNGDLHMITELKKLIDEFKADSDNNDHRLSLSFTSHSTDFGLQIKLTSATVDLIYSGWVSYEQLKTFNNLHEGLSYMIKKSVQEYENSIFARLGIVSVRQQKRLIQVLVPTNIKLVRLGDAYEVSNNHKTTIIQTHSGFENFINKLMEFRG